jgi:hypothetical protein
VDDTGRPVEVPQVVPETELEIEALKRLWGANNLLVQPEN